MKRKKEKQRLKKLNFISLITGSITVVTGILRMVFMFTFSEFWLIDLGLTVVWAVLLVKLLNELTNAVEYKYM